jgi:class 3 adenylate cyclase
MAGPEGLYLVEPQAGRFLAGSPHEPEALFGSPLPLLPPFEIEQGRKAYFVHSHPRLRTLLQRHLQGLLLQIGQETPGVSRADAFEREQAEYETALTRVLASARAGDRRQGLVNLFWLAHSREAAEILKELESKTPQVRKAKYSLQPLLATFYKRLDQLARKDAKDSSALVEAIVDDGFAFTEATIAGVDFNQFLPVNKRYRLSVDLFFEIYQTLLRDAERRVRESDRGLVTRIVRSMPQLPRDQWTTQPGLVKIIMNAQVMTYLFSDAWTVGAKLAASPKLKAEAERRRPSEILDGFLDLVAGVKRFELISGIRERIHLLQDRDLDESARRGRRVYEFAESARVVNNAVNATVLFLDLRGFTKTSEGQISERDLTQELYTVFDAFVPSVRHFGGTIDKFLGDGIMMTFGTQHGDPLDPLNALRTAIQCQDTLHRLRQEGKTYFKMGIAIHYGRVYLARFVVDEESVQATVIGRNVNLAGRLSSAAKRSLDEDDGTDTAPPGATRASGLQVTVDKAGTLFNEGIAISRDTLVQLEAHLPLVHQGEGTSSVMEYFDESIGRRILIRYAGDAKFKGVSSSFPVYEVDYEV